MNPKVALALYERAVGYLELAEMVLDECLATYHGDSDYVAISRSRYQACLDECDQAWSRYASLEA